MALAVPATKPEVAFVQQRLLAERIPTQTDTYVSRTIGMFAQDPQVESSIRLLLSQYNDEATEEILSNETSAVVSGFMPTFAASEIPIEEVNRWYLDNGFA
jgi:hypothetical protein